MVRFDPLEDKGVSIAAMSGMEDGDCGWSPEAFASRAVFAGRCGLSAEDLVSVRQVHGRDIAVVGGEQRGCGADRETLQSAPVADGMITSTPGLPLVITVADCVPVFLVAPTAIGLIHAGREGTRQNIAAEAVSALNWSFGVRPDHLTALIGPAAGPCCYEVGQAMADTWCDSGLPLRGRMLDLWEANRRQLVAAGVPEGQTVVDGRCTICSDLFHSFRRDGGAARNLAVLCR